MPSSLSKASKGKEKGPPLPSFAKRRRDIVTALREIGAIKAAATVEALLEEQNEGLKRPKYHRRQS